MRKSSGSSDIYASPQRQLCADGSLPDGAGECHNLPPPGGGCGTCEKGYVKDPDNYCVRDPKTPTPQPTNPCDQNPNAAGCNQQTQPTQTPPPTPVSPPHMMNQITINK